MQISDELRQSVVRLLPELNEISTIGREAQDAGLEVIKPGVPVGHIAEVIRKKAAEHEFEIHGGRIGHGMGMDYSERPSLSESNDALRIGFRRKSGERRQLHDHPAERGHRRGPRGRRLPGLQADSSPGNGNRRKSGDWRYLEHDVSISYTLCRVPLWWGNATK